MHQVRHLETPQSRLVERLDVYAMGLSVLCLLHCLGTPVLVILLLPLAAHLSDSHWIHRTLVIMAAPATLWVVYATRKPLFTVTALSGLGLLLAAAFVGRLETHELRLTMAGSLLLGAAHLWHRTISIRERHRRTV